MKYNPINSLKNKELGNVYVLWNPFLTCFMCESGSSLYRSDFDGR